MRAFIAIEIPAQLQNRLTSVSQALAALLEGERSALRWSGAEKFHLTLRFLGETDADQQRCIDRTLREVASVSSPFGLTLGGLGAFPAWRKLRVLWAGVGGDVGALQRLQTGVETGVQACGFAAERQAFNPHITLARASRDADRLRTARAGALLAAQTEMAQSLGHWEVSELVLMRSDLQPGGAVHTPQGRYPLGG